MECNTKKNGCFDASPMTKDNWDGLQLATLQTTGEKVWACQMNLPEGFQITMPRDHPEHPYRQSDGSVFYDFCRHGNCGDYIYLKENGDKMVLSKQAGEVYLVFTGEVDG